MKIYKLLAVLIISAILLIACSYENPESASRYKVWMITKSMETQFWLSAMAGANAARSEYNIDMTIVGPDTEEDYEQQNALIAQAVDDGADAIVFSAISYTENAPVIDSASEAGVRIVIIDSDVDSDRVNSRIGTDNVQAGRMTGRAVLDTTQHDLYVGIVNFDLGSKNGQERELGLREVLEQDARVRGIYTINVSATPVAAETGAEILLNDHPEINMLVGLNEPLAVGCTRIVDNSDLAGKVQVVGFDTNLECVDGMRNGIVNALIAQNPYAMGYLGVERALALIEGQSFDAYKWLDTATTIVTQENMFTQESQQALFFFG